MKKFIACLAFMLASVSCLAWPTKDITIVVPYPPGSMSDHQSRILQSEFNNMFKVNTIVKFVPGAASSIALQQVLNTENDNHTFIWVNDDWITSQIASGKHLYLQFSPLAVWGQFPMIVFGGPNYNLVKFKEQIKNKKPINVGNIGVNGHQYLWITNLKSDVTINPIPYKGLAPMTVDILGGNLEYGISNMASMTDLVKEGKVNPIMISTGNRTSMYKDVPTAKELGFEGEPMGGSLGFIARKDTDPTAFQAMSDAVRTVISNNKAFQDYSMKGITIVNMDIESSRKYADKVIAHTKTLKFAKE